jgi:hypothetical protein
LSSLRQSLAFSGIILIIFSSFLYIQYNNEVTSPEENSSLFFVSFLIWSFGLVLIGIWIRKERSIILKMSMAFLILGQITLWILGSVIHNSFNSSNITPLVLAIMFFWSGSGILVLVKNLKKYKYTERKGFPKYIKEKVLQKQNNKCAHCKRYLIVRDYDHKDGNRSNNDISNCQVLCPNCHAIKTRRELKK